MIASFGDKATEALFHGSPSRLFGRYPPSILKAASRRLDMLNMAEHINDLKSPPGNRLEALKGNLAGLHSIRVNDQWRVVFRWEGSSAFDVILTDYHS